MITDILGPGLLFTIIVLAAYMLSVLDDTQTWFLASFAQIAALAVGGSLLLWVLLAVAKEVLS